MHDRILYRLTWLAATLSLGHHLDHLIRGNAVGWPLSEEVNAFTVTCVYETRRWAQQRRTRHATRLVGMGGVVGLVGTRVRPWLGQPVVEPRQRLEDANWPTPSQRNRTYRWTGRRLCSPPGEFGRTRRST
jgi:hypothetical protein